MERQKHFIAILLLFISLTVSASYQADVYKAYIGNDMKLWKQVLDQMHLQKVKSNDFRAELLNYQYGYIGWCIGSDKIEEAEQYIALGESNISILEKSGYRPALIQAYKSAFYGYAIGVSAYKAPYLGPKSISCAQLSMQLDSSCPMGYIQYANANFYMPAVFGGSKHLALKDYKKAETLMEAKPGAIKGDWNYLSLMLMIAQAYAALDDYKSAKAYYAKILRIEPRFLWVKNELYPDIVRKLNQKI